MKKPIRKIPATMATQHPDHAGKPYWHHEPFISTRHEAMECFLCFSDLGISEYKWDWEGKLVDESVLERLLAGHFEYFQKNPIGKEKFLTFRLPNPKVETEFRLGRALMGIMSAASLAKQVELHTPPLFEVILPMTESAEEMASIQEAFSEISSLKHPLNKFDTNTLKQIEIIPLFEQVDTIIHSDKILEKYLNIHKEKFGYTPPYLRPYVARSDPALNSGIVPTILSIKIALSRYQNFAKKRHMALYPVIGVGTLPFRGGISPERPEQFIEEYKGIRTAIIQSAFRYDFPKRTVVRAIELLEKQLPRGKAQTVSLKEEKEILKLIPHFEKPYQQTIEHLAPTINAVAAFLPKRRERVQHIGLFGYSRGVGKVKLPRAISFTAALYSLGIPPELIGTGRGLAAAQKSGHAKLIEKFYVNLKKDLEFAGRFLHKPAILELSKKHPGWKEVLEDIEAIEAYLGKKLRPRTSDDLKHYELAGKIHKKLKKGGRLTPFIEKSALLRKSMG